MGMRCPIYNYSAIILLLLYYSANDARNLQRNSVVVFGVYEAAGRLDTRRPTANCLFSGLE